MKCCSSTTNHASLLHFLVTLGSRYESLLGYDGAIDYRIVL